MLTSTEMRRYIARKRDGEPLPGAAWEAIIASFMHDTIDEAQVAALAMACVVRGMEREEIVALTAAMVDSGDRLRFPPDFHCVDKHSTGGVADTVSLIVVPLVAACGVRVAKLAGRSLGHTGGTLDKLEAIPGCRIELTPQEFRSVVERAGCAIAAQSASFVPADKRLYALRDRTATVPSVGLIAASIVSKKIVGGADAFVFDVKTGRGAFMTDLENARVLAQTLVDVAGAFGKPASALITAMDEPLGPAIGSGIEAIEAREFLRGTRRDPRLLEVVGALGAALLSIGGQAGDCRGRLTRALDDGSAYATFVRMVEAQGASVGALEAMVTPSDSVAVKAHRSGFVVGVDPVVLGEAAREAVQRGGPLAGVVVRARVGDAVIDAAELARVYGAHDLASRVAAAFTLGDEAPPRAPLVYESVPPNR